MMLKPHFRRILYLCGGAAEQLRRRRGSHSARHADLALAPYLGTRNRCVLLHYIAEKTGRGKRTEYALLAEALRRVQMVQHRRHYAARAAGGRGDDKAARGILLRNSKSICVYKTAAFERFAIPLGMYVIAHSLAPHAKTAGQHAFCLYAALNSRLHHLPYLGKIIPYFLALAVVDILPVCLSRLLAVAQDIRDFGERIYVGAGIAALSLLDNIASANGIYRPVVKFRARCVECPKSHTVGMKGKNRFGFPHYFSGSHCRKFGKYGLIGKVAAACSRESAIKRHFIARGTLACAAGEQSRGLLRPHGVRAARPVPYLV